jgi:hypothetical protein
MRKRGKEEGGRRKRMEEEEGRKKRDGKHCPPPSVEFH